ncbi:MAG: DedA family protein [Phycisphaerae bacterium]
MEQIVWEFLSHWSYLGLFLILMAAGLGLPLPEDIPLILAGLVVSRTDGNLTLMMFTGIFGVIVGDSALFFLGRRYGADIMERRWFRRIAKPWLIEKARQKYEHHGAKILFLGRFMPGLRAVLFMTAGVFKIPYWKLLAFDGSAAFISVPLWIWAGWYFNTKIGEVFTSAKIATIVLFSLLALALIIWVVWEYYHNLRKRNRPEDGESPSRSSSGILEQASASVVDSPNVHEQPTSAESLPLNTPPKTSTDTTSRRLPPDSTVGSANPTHSAASHISGSIK